VTANIAFLAGYIACTLRVNHRVHEEAAQRFKEFLIVAEDRGIIDHARLAEVVASATEVEETPPSLLQPTNVTSMGH
jgi:L-serine deaminase